MKWKYITTDPKYSGLYQVWKAMRQRCADTANPNYGGRGISVCDRWKNNFDAFVDDMGPRPEGMTLERYDNDGNYDPFNCIWATLSEQRQNSRPVIAARSRVKGVADVLTHGSKRMYEKHKCRCEICVANFRKRKRRKPASRPGTDAHKKKLEYLKNYHREKRNREYDL